MRNSPAPPYADPALYEQLLAGSLQGVLIVHGGRVALANLSAAELFGYASAEALTGEPLSSLFAGDDAACLSAPPPDADAHGGAPLRRMAEGLHLDGSPRTLELTVLPVRWKAELALQVTLLDRTEELALREMSMQRDSELQDLIDGSLQGMFVHREHKLLLANRSLAEMFGYVAPNDILKLESALQLYDPTERERVHGYYQERLQGSGAPMQYEFLGRRRDGSPVWLDSVVRSISWRGERAILVTVVDISERRRAEQELEASQRLVQAVFDMLPYSVYVKDTASRYIMVNAASGRILDMAQADVLGKRMEELGYGDTAVHEQIYAVEREVLQSGEPREIPDLKVRLPNGRVVRRHLRRRPLYDHEGHAVGLLGVSEDITERKEAEERLRESEQMLRTMMDALPQSIVFKDPDQRYCLANRAFLDFWGFAEKEVLGRTIQELWAHRAPAMRTVAEAEQRALRYGVTVELPQVEQMDATGRPSLRHVRKIPIRDGTGKVSGVVSVAEDITARVAAERRLRDSERLLRTVIDTLPQAVAVKDTQGRYRVANRALTEFYGIPEEQLLGKGLHELWPDWTPSLESAWRAEQDAMRTGKALHLPAFTLKTEDGREVIRHTVKMPLLDDSGQAVGIVGVAEDITERKRVEEELHSSRQLLETVFNVLPLWVFVKDAERRFVLVNRRMAEDHALTEPLQPHTRTLLSDSAQEEELRAIAELDRRVIEGGETVTVDEVEVTMPDLQPHAFRTVRMPLQDAAGKVVGLVGIAEDITEQKRTSHAMQQAQKLESLGVLAGGIAHDFNNLLVSILGNASLALMDLPPDAPGHEVLEQIETAGQRAAELCRQLLAYSGQGSLELASVDLNTLIQDMLQLLHVSMPKGVDLHTSFEDDLPALDVDPTQLRQVLMNLVMNAAEAMEERQGRVLVSTGALHADRELLKAYINGEHLPAGDYVCLRVRDSGQGMAEDTVSRIFDPFFSTKFPGRGLGLAAVLGIVRGHRGALHVHSAPGEGSTFTLLLPAGTGLADPALAAAASGAWQGEGTVLVVDDEAEVRRVLRRMLTGLGFTVLEAQNGLRALEAMGHSAERIRAVLLDLTMPGMDGGETLRELRGLRADLPVMMMSGYSEQEIQNRLAHMDVRQVLQKPFTLTTLTGKLRSLLG